MREIPSSSTVTVFSSLGERLSIPEPQAREDGHREVVLLRQNRLQSMA
jgi:hypothetical protein